MHSFQPSRGRVFFEVLLALGMAGSLAGAWTQTGASALLAGAGVAAVYGLIHLFDMRRRKSDQLPEPQRIAFDAEIEPAARAHAAAAVRPSAEDQPPAADTGRCEALIVQLPTVEEKPEPKSKPARKGGGRRTKAAKATKAAEPVPGDQTDASWPMAVAGAEPVLASSADEEEFAFPADGGAAHPHIAPLFEPEPFARMPRRAFGRRGRL